MKLVFRREGIHGRVPSEEASKSKLLAVVDDSFSGLLALISDPSPSCRTLDGLLAICNVALRLRFVKGFAPTPDGSFNLAQHQGAALPTPSPWSATIRVLEGTVACSLHLRIGSK